MFTVTCDVFHDRDKYRFYACMLRARFDENKNEKDLVKATLMLKAGEEEFWSKQHPQPYIFPDSPGGTSYERYDCYKVRRPLGHVFSICGEQNASKPVTVLLSPVWCFDQTVGLFTLNQQKDRKEK